MRLILAMILTAAMLFIASVGGYKLVSQGRKQAAQNAEPRCDAIQPLLKDIMKNRHLGFLSTAIDDKGQVYMYLTSDKTGDWVMLNVEPGAQRACVFMQGTDWQFIAPAKFRVKEMPPPHSPEK